MGSFQMCHPEISTHMHTCAQLTAHCVHGIQYQNGGLLITAKEDVSECGMAPGTTRLTNVCAVWNFWGEPMEHLNIKHEALMVNQEPFEQPGYT